MLSKPICGWTDFSIGKNTYGLSYLTNIPIEWLNQAIHGLETLEPFAVHGLLEPERMICLISYWNCHIIIEDEEKGNLSPSDISYEIANVNMLDFCRMLYTDISTNIEEWCNWGYLQEKIETEEIKIKLKKLAELIEEKSKHFR